MRTNLKDARRAIGSGKACPRLPRAHVTSGVAAQSTALPIHQSTYPTIHRFAIGSCRALIDSFPQAHDHFPAHSVPVFDFETSNRMSEIMPPCRSLLPLFPFVRSGRRTPTTGLPSVRSSLPLVYPRQNKAIKGYTSLDKAKQASNRSRKATASPCKAAQASRENSLASLACKPSRLPLFTFRAIRPPTAVSDLRPPISHPHPRLR
jgi:hypothetical protein